VFSRSSVKNNGRRLTATLLIFLGTAAAAAQPALRVEGGLTFDFGTLYTIVPVSRELTITNAGDDTLTISGVSGSCGCTATLLSNKTIPPGGNGSLKITFDPAKMNGKVEKVVSMRTNDPAEPNPHITFTATISQILGIDQDHLVFYTEPDSESHTTVTLRNRSDVPINITGIASTPPDLRADLPDRLIPPGDQAELRCSITPATPGILRGDLVISTDHPDVPTLTLRYFCYAKRAPAGSAPSGKR